MHLAPGTLIGPYEVTSLLGEGGMGQVYQARDHRLGRDVAIKVLPPAVAADEERLRRFEQEARAVGRLAHPGILVVFDTGLHEGAPYLVTELLKGRTLREALAQGPLPLRLTLDMGGQIADALAAAHQQGIVHRDLKPENLFLGPDDRVKILDFGLAKWMERKLDGLATNQEVLPTLPLQTLEGTLLGTMGYMSPEQVRSESVDGRSDLFALGVVLYEMVSGARPFLGASAMETLHAILKEDPPELRGPKGPVPPVLDRIIGRCLEKAPANRFQNAQDLAFALKSVAAGAVSSSATLTESMSIPAATSRWKAWVAAAVLLAGGGAGYWIGRRGPSETPLRLRRVSARQGFVQDARFSNGGKDVLVTATWDAATLGVYALASQGGEPRAQGLSGAFLLAPSLKGDLAVIRDNGTLARVSRDTGAPRDLQEHVVAADWSPDGEHLAAIVSEGGEYRVEYPLGQVIHRSVDPLAGLRVGPDGRRVLFLKVHETHRTLMLCEGSGPARALETQIQETWWAAFHPRTGEVYFQGGQAMLDRGALFAMTPGRRPRKLMQLPPEYTPLDVDAAGRVLLRRTLNRSEMKVVTFPSKEERDLSWGDTDYLYSLSADGKQVLFRKEEDPSTQSWSTYIRATDGSPAVKLGDGSPFDFSPDGKWVLTYNPQTTPATVELLPTGPGRPKRLDTGGLLPSWMNRFMPGGKQVLLLAREGGGGFHFYLQDVDSSHRVPVGPEQVLQSGGRPAPDGRRFAYRTQEGFGLWDLDTRTGQNLLSAASGLRMIQWSADGKAWYLWNQDPKRNGVERMDLATRKRTILFTFPTGQENGGINSLALTADGTRMAYTYARLLASDLFILEPAD